MSLQINSANWIYIDNRDTGLRVTQRRDGTVVYTRERWDYHRALDVGESAVTVQYAEHKMPHARYMLSSDSPITKPGVATRAQFEADVLALLGGAA